MQLALPPDQLAAWGQLAGALFTLAAVVVALWVAIHDVRRRDRETRELRAAQALTVVAAVRTFNPDGTARIVFVTGAWQAVVIENFGRLPVTDIVIHGVAGSHHGKRLGTWCLKHGDEVDHLDQTDYFVCAVLGPGVAVQSPTLYFSDVDDRDIPFKSGIAVRTAEIDFSFVDADGVRWRRSGSTPPVRVVPPVQIQRADGAK